MHELKAHFSFATLLAILFLTFLDNTIASAVLTSVQSKLHAGVSELQWVVGGYALAFASLMLICGSLGDNFGRKRIMLIGVAIFCCGSVVCAFSDTPTQLIIGRVIMGVGAAGSEPSTLSMIRHIYPDRRLRARALGAWAAVSGLALALGPVIGGILVGLWTWRSVFWFNFIFGGVVLVVGTIALPESVNEIRRRIDVPGFILAAIALGCATFATIAGETWGYYSSSVLSLYSIAGLSFLVYFVVESRTKFPMLNVRWVDQPRLRRLDGDRLHQLLRHIFHLLLCRALSRGRRVGGRLLPRGRLLAALGRHDRRVAVRRSLGRPRGFARTLDGGLPARGCSAYFSPMSPSAPTPDCPRSVGPWVSRGSDLASSSCRSTPPPSSACPRRTPAWPLPRSIPAANSAQ